MLKTIDADASPEKRLFIEMFTRDLSFEDCILDLIDNSIDSYISYKNYNIQDILSLESKADIDSQWVDIKIVFDNMKFKISDNSGGIKIDYAEKEVFKFGHVGETSGKLGVYGIGLKRAIFKMGKKISIESNYESEAFKTKINVAEWEKSDKWSIPLSIIEPHEIKISNGTSIIIEDLREDIKEIINKGFLIANLLDTIGKTYALFLDKFVNIYVNDIKVAPKRIPLAQSEEVNYAKEEFDINNVNVKILAGLGERNDEITWEAKNAGWYVACNGRLVVIADKTDLTGWGFAKGPIYVPKYRGFIGIVLFFSDNGLELPWNTMKQGLNEESFVFQRTRVKMVALARPILSFFDKFYSTTESENQSYRRMTEKLLSANIREKKTNNESFSTNKIPYQLQDPLTRVQYDAKKSELDKIKSHLKKRSLSASKIGRITFDYYLENECPD
jgi:Histidine kinase-, DNA gyrase B-, and HSP90-like ATPase